MPSSASPTFAQARSQPALGLAAAGAIAVMGLIPATAVVGEWWLLGVTFATLVSTAGLIVVALFGLLAETGDAMAGTGVAAKRRRASGTRAAAGSGVRVPVLHSA